MAGIAPGRAHRLLARARHRDAVRRREAVRHERRLERDDGALLLERGGDLVGDADQVVHGASVPCDGCPAPLRAWRRRCRRSGLPPRARASGPPTSQPAASASPGAGRVDDVLDRQRWALVAVERAPGRAALLDPLRSGRPATEGARLVLVREDDVGRDPLEHRAELLDAGVPDPRPGGQVDAHARIVPNARRSTAGAPPSAPARRTAHSRRHGASRSPRARRCRPASGSKSDRGAAVRAHRAPAVGVDERDDHAATPVDRRAAELDAVGGEPRLRQAPDVVGRPLARASATGAERRHPGGHVRRLAARPDGDRRRCVTTRRERLLQADDHVEHEVSERADEHGVRSSHGRRRASRQAAPLVRDRRVSSAPPPRSLPCVATSRRRGREANERSRCLRERSVLPGIRSRKSGARARSLRRRRGAADRADPPISRC